MSARRAAVVLVVFALLAAALLVSPASLSPKEYPGDPIELTGEVGGRKCAPCHLRLAEATVPGLIFTHGNHLIVGCFACHYAQPHRDGRAARPTMQSCFNCHGIYHGPTGVLATGDCEDCHTSTFQLRPGDHVADWAGAAHAQVPKAIGNVNRCLMCHEPTEDCDACHLDEGVETGPMPERYEPILKVRPDTPLIEVYPEGRVTMGQCVFCHPDVDDFLPDALIFEHAGHLGRSYDCEICHVAFPHSPDQVDVPSMEGCYRCHGLNHAERGLVATEGCEACHPPEFELRPEDHTDAFVSEEHKVGAAEDGANCAMCHTEALCVECHTGQRPDTEPVVPEDHLVADWIWGMHGRRYLAQHGMCGSCHLPASCTQCHQTAMPHPTTWMETHGEQSQAYDDCDVCHRDRSRCQDCHHDQLRLAELVKENCTPCHEEMEHEPATEIQVKGLAEHAVHFEVAETVGRPYVCLDCHVGFGIRDEGHIALVPEQGHDLRLCYECHGALDHRKVMIAPWPGRELCVRCHTDIFI